MTTSHPSTNCDAGQPLSPMACRLFIAYLAGVSTPRIAAHTGYAIGRVNRSILRTATHLLQAVGSDYEKRQPLPGLNRLKKDTPLWLFRLSIVAPTAAALALIDDGGQALGENAPTGPYRQLCAALKQQLEKHQQLSDRPASRAAAPARRAHARQHCTKEAACP